LEYDKNINPMEALGNTSWPQEILYEILEMNILEIDQEKQFGVWSYKLKFSWYDRRIKWPEECQIEANQTKLHPIRSDMLNYLWNPVSIFREVTSPAKPHMENTITISKVNSILFHSVLNPG
jgi:hypothetical protein